MENTYNGFDFIKRIETRWQEIENLKPETERKKLKHTTLAETIGIDSVQISRWQNAKSYPKVETLIKIAESLDCSIDYLIGTDKPNDNNKNIIDILRDLFIMDAKAEKHKYLNERDLYTFMEYIDTVFHFLNISKDYIFLIEDYMKMRNAYKYITDEKIRIGIIEDLINKNIKYYIDQT